MSWLSLVGNIMWIFGLATIIAGMGWQLWQSGKQTRQPVIMSTGIMMDIGAIIFCIGLSLVVTQVWLRILYIILACGFVAILIYDLRKPIKAQH